MTVGPSARYGFGVKKLTGVELHRQWLGDRADRSHDPTTSVLRCGSMPQQPRPLLMHKKATHGTSIFIAFNYYTEFGKVHVACFAFPVNLRPTSYLQPRKLSEQWFGYAHKPYTSIGICWETDSILLYHLLQAITHYSLMVLWRYNKTTTLNILCLLVIQQSSAKYSTCFM